MENNELPFKKANTASSDENQNTIGNYKKVAKHFEEAAKYYHEAAKHHEAENFDKALECTLKAKGRLALAGPNQKEISIYHALHN